MMTAAGYINADNETSPRFISDVRKGWTWWLGELSVMLAPRGGGFFAKLKGFVIHTTTPVRTMIKPVAIWMSILHRGIWCAQQYRLEITGNQQSRTAPCLPGHWQHFTSGGFIWWYTWVLTFWQCCYSVQTTDNDENFIRQWPRCLKRRLRQRRASKAQVENLWRRTWVVFEGT